MGAPLAYFEITGPDADALGRFYGALFDWTINDGPEAGYSMIDTGTDQTGGIGGGEAAVTIYMRVDDLQATLDRAAEHGGKTLVEPTELPGGYGHFAVFADPAGNGIGLWA
jgi:predicted enzyme related to lactoylglutathione lyase